MFEFFVSFLISVGISYLNRADPQDRAAPTEGDITYPTASSSRKIPYFAGNVKIDGANIFWGDDYSNIKITEKVKTSLLSSKRVTVAYRTKYGLAYALGWGCKDTYLIRVIIDDKDAFFELSNNDYIPLSEGTYTVDKPYLFNNSSTTSNDINGVMGDFDFYQGTDEQTSNEYMIKFDLLVPRFKNLCYIVFKEFEWGTSVTNLPACKFEMMRLPQKISPEFSNIDNSANPVEILYEILTEKEKFGLGVNDEDIDFDNFLEVAETLYNENLGMDVIFNSETTADTIKTDIEKHINASIYVNLYTGKWNIKLIRDDFVKEDLPFFNEDNISSYSSYSKQQLSDLINEVKIIYKNRYENFNESTATAINNSISKIKSSYDSQEINYFGFTNPSTAQRVAQRDLNALSNVKISLNIKVNRDGFGLNIGDAILVSLDDLDIKNIVFRVREVDLGKFDDNKITLNLIQDVFEYGNALQDVPPTSGWNKISDYEYDIHDLVVQTPMFLYEKRVDLKDHLSKTQTFLVMCSSYNTLEAFPFTTYKYKVGLEMFNNYEYDLIDQAEDSTPFSVVKSRVFANSYLPFDPDNHSIYIADSLGNSNLSLNKLVFKNESQRRLGENLALIKTENAEEFISFEEAIYDPETNLWELTKVWRGLLDTPPMMINSSEKITTTLEDKIFFLSYGFAYSNFVKTGSSTSYSYKFNTSIFKSYINKESELHREVTLEETGYVENDTRIRKPLPAANIKITTDKKIDSDYYKEEDLSFTFDKRERTNVNQIYKYYEDFNEEPENNVEYRIKIYEIIYTLIEGSTNSYDVTSNLIKEDVTTSNSYTFTDELTINSNNEYYNNLEVSIEAYDNDFNCSNYRNSIFRFDRN